MFSQLNYTTISVLFLAAFLFEHALWKSPGVGALLAAVFFLFFGSHLGRRILPEEPRVWQTCWGGTLLLSALMILGTAIYYLAFLPPDLWVLVVLLTPVAVWLIHPHARHWRLPRLSLQHHRIPATTLALLSFGLILLVTALDLLRQTDIFDAVRSPWERIPPEVLWIAALLYLILVVLCWRGRERSLTLPYAMLVALLTVGVTAVVYPLGFGFDSFLHQATESHIAEFGTIDPKPFYYIGQYVAVLFLHQGFHLPLVVVDRFLLPILAGVLLPLAFFFTASHLTKHRSSAFFAILSFFLLPLSTFIVTTPQGLANLWILLLILLSLPHLAGRGGLGLGGLTLLAMTSVAIHPLAGIPAVIYLALVTIRTWSTMKFERSRAPLFWIVSILGAFAIPVAFLVSSAVSGLTLSFDFAALAPAELFRSSNINLVFQSGFNTLLDFVYLLDANLLLMFIVVALFTSIKMRHLLPPTIILPLTMTVIVAINYVVLKSAVDFTFLIDYERSNYSARLVTLLFFFLVPYLILFFIWLHENTVRRGLLPKLLLTLILTAILTSQFYLHYPRRDNYETSHGFNTGTADILAVEQIHADAPPNYIVLANQQVAAAAVSTYGFARYYGDVFYYPIPTGGELYQYFLKMNTSPNRETARAAQDLAGVGTAYYVVNDYWWQAPRLIETAKSNADDWFALENGRVHVFRYDR